MFEKLLRIARQRMKKNICMLLACIMLLSMVLSSPIYAAASIAWKQVGEDISPVGSTIATSIYTDGGTSYIAYTDGERFNRPVVRKLVGSNWEVLDGSDGDGYVADEGAYKFSFYVYKGTPYLAYLSGEVDNIKLTVMKYDSTGEWVSVGGTYGVANDDIGLYVQEDIPYVAFEAMNNIMVLKFLANNTNSIVGSPIQAIASGISLKGDGKGTMYLAYEETVEGETTVKVRRNISDGSTWDTVGVVSSGVASDPALYLYKDIPYVAYTEYIAQDEDQPYKSIVKKLNVTNWELVGAGYVSSEAAALTNNSLYIDDVNEKAIPYVAYTDHNPMPKVWKLDVLTGNWVTADNTNNGYASSGAMSGLSLSVEDGIPYAAYISYGSVMVMRYAISPSILSHPAPQTVAVGQTAAFTINAAGTGTLYYQWEKNGQAIPGAASSTLKITNAQLTDAGSYTCYVSNAVGVVTSNAATLTVNESGSGNPQEPSDWTNVGEKQISKGIAYYVSSYMYNGTPYIAYVDTQAGNRVTVKKYNGSAWENVGSMGFSNEYPSFLSLYVYNEVPYVAYADDGNAGKVTVMKYEGNNWAPVGIPGFSADYAYYTSLYVYNDVPYVAYQDGGNDYKATVMKYDEGHWAPVGDVGFSAGNATSMSLYVYNNIPYVAYQDGGNSAKATVMKYNGESWMPVGNTGISIGYAGSLSLSIYNEIPYVAFTDAGNDGKAMVMKCVEDSWEPIGELGCSEGFASHTSLFIDNDIPYVAYRDYQNSKKATVKKYYGGKWETIGAAGFSSGEASEISLYVYNGVPYVGYTEGGEEGYATFMKYGTAAPLTYTIKPIDAQTFTELMEGYASGEQESKSIKIENTGTGTLTGVSVSLSEGENSSFEVAQNYETSVASGDFTTFTIKAKSGLAAGTYSETVTISANNMTSVTFQATQVVNPDTPQESKDWILVGNERFSAGDASYVSSYVYNGTPYVAYMDSANDDKITVMKFDGKEWKTMGEPGFSLNSVAYTSLYIYEGIPYVAYSDNGKITVMRYEEAKSSWESVGNPRFSAGYAYYTSLYIDKGVPYVAYQDSSSNYKATVMKYEEDSEGGSWKPVGSPGFSAGIASSISLRIDEEVLYVAYTESGKAMVMKYDEDSWKLVGSPGFSAGYVSSISLRIDEGVLYVAYTDNVNGFKPTVMKYEEDGEVWSWKPVGKAGFTDGYTSETAFYIDEGVLYVAYKDYLNDEKKATVMKYNGESWENVGKARFSKGEVSDISLYVDNGTPYVTYRDGGETGQVTVMKYGTAAPLTYTIKPIDAQTFSAVIEGYASGAQESKSIKIENTGTGTLTGLMVSLNEGENSSFEVKKGYESSLASGDSTTFTIKAKDGLAAGTYTELVTISANNMTSVTFQITQVVNPGTATAPGVPTGVTAVAGDRQATVSFTPPANNGGTPITGYVVTSTPEGRTATGTGNSIVIAGLTNGVSYTFTVKAVNAAGTGAASTASNAVTPYRTSSRDDDDSPSAPNPSTPATSAPTPETPAPAQTDSGVVVLVNGKAENAGTAVHTKEGSREVTTIKVDGEKLQKKLESEGSKSVVTIPVNSKSDVIVGELNAQMVRNMENKQAVLEVKTETVSYKIPAQQININAVSEKIGQSVALQDIKIQVIISKSPEATVKVLENSAQKGSFSITAPPVDFSIRGSYGDKNVEVSSFNAYVERMIAIPEGVDPNKITTGIAMEADGTVRHIPTQVTVIDGKYYAKLNSLTNSTYSVVWHPLEFKDAAGHWAKDAINNMGSRMIITGGSDGMFQPDRSITRGEFAAIVVRALGLKPGIGTESFEDVQDSDWYSGYIKTAYGYGIITGYSAVKFGPNDSITREQAMTMIARAMEITPLKAEVAAEELQKLLGNFSDGQTSSAFAKEGIAACVKTGVIQGKNSNLLAPKDNITRAEVAVIIKRMLQKANLIN